MHPDPALQAAYDNRAMVPEHPAIIAGWQRDAAAWRDAAPLAELDVAYGTGERERVDLFWPTTDHSAPLALFVHGGYWQALDRKLFSHCARGLNAAGLGVAVPSYDLCPGATIHEIVEQLRRCCDCLWRCHGRPLVAVGHSAGGHLAAVLLATDWPRAKSSAGLPAGLVRAAVPISGVFDLRPLRRTTIGNALRLTDDAAAAAVSPHLLPAPGRPLHGFVGGDESEAFRRQTRDFAQAWGGEATELPGLNHFTVLTPLADARSQLVRTIAVLMPRG